MAAKAQLETIRPQRNEEKAQLVCHALNVED